MNARELRAKRAEELTAAKTLAADMQKLHQEALVPAAAAVRAGDLKEAQRLVVEKEGRVSVEWRIALRPGATSGQRFVLKAR